MHEWQQDFMQMHCLLDDETAPGMRRLGLRRLARQYRRMRRLSYRSMVEVYKAETSKELERLTASAVSKGVGANALIETGMRMRVGFLKLEAAAFLHWLGLESSASLAGRAVAEIQGLLSLAEAA
jgi:hypothetical protein